MKKINSKAAPTATTPTVLTLPFQELHQCTNCPRLVPLLVEGTDLCISCDARLYPELVIA